jgi:hypothetical protein
MVCNQGYALKEPALNLFQNCLSFSLSSGASSTSLPRPKSTSSMFSAAAFSPFVFTGAEALPLFTAGLFSPVVAVAPPVLIFSVAFCKASTSLDSSSVIELSYALRSSALVSGRSSVRFH